MTPILLGRWQSRVFLLGTIGLLPTLFFVVAFGSILPLVALVLIIIFGFGWDLLYALIQTRFWDNDWPTVLQFAAGMFEGLFLFIFLILIPFGPNPSIFQFWVNYLAVWTITFLASQSFMRLFFPRWRYRGGRIV